MKVYFAMGQGFSLVVCPISLCYDCCFVISNTLEREGDKNCLISLKLKVFVLQIYEKREKDANDQLF